MIRYLLLLSVVSIVAFTSMTCHSPTQPPGHDTFTLTLSDTSCTEAWLKVHLGGAFGSRTVEITRDSTVVLTLKLPQTDTTIADTGLLPNRAYTYVAELANGTTKSADPLYVRTLDTTSGSFTFQKFTLGGASSSMLNDIAIINDTLAYAVGLIYGYDSTGQVDQQPYSIAKWDGKNWNLMKLFDNSGLVVTPIRGILVDDSTIWLAAGSVYTWDGVSSHAKLSLSRLTLSDPNATIENLWGTSNSSLYGVGNSGTIIHYNGSTWTQIASGTTLDIQDIYGSGGQLLAVANSWNPYGETILSINGTTASHISSAPLVPDLLYGVWFIPNRHYYVVGDGIYEKHLLSESTWKNGNLDITKYATTKVKGNGINDVFVVGAYGEFLHYNGVRWQSYIGTTGIDGVYSSVALYGNLVIAVGENSSQQAVVLIGKRN